jgi:glucose/arabinose dehydrogenase
LLPVPAARADTLLTTVRVASGLDAPIYATAPAGDARLFVVEQRGVIRILDQGAVLPQPFLDIDSLVASGGERGLLGLAFHPAYGTNGRFFVHYSNLGGHTTLAEYRVSSDPDRADHGSARILLTVTQPYPNHNGGQLEFGPNDGYLYLALGDGGSGGDPQDRAQNPNELLGKILRLDVDGALPYAVPASNPFVGVPGARPEIWALGLRNPYRTAFDRVTGDLWIGDVGQNAWEEVDFQPRSSPGGENYGWARMEGLHCYPPTASCRPDTLVLPVAEYDHGSGRCSITGGRVYRGSAIPWLAGTYFYADFCSAQIFSLRYDGVAVSDGMERTAELAPTEIGAYIDAVTAIAEDGFGELYIVDHGGEIFQIVDRDTTAPSPAGGPALSIQGVAPNPFQNLTHFAVGMPRSGPLEVAIYSAAGRLVRRLAGGQAAAGSHPLAWDGTDDAGTRVPSGVYIVRARSGSLAATLKLERFR